MPKKPIKPDRVRFPKECLRAEILYYVVCAGTFPALVTTESFIDNRSGFWPTMIVIVTATATCIIAASVYSLRVRRRWMTRVMEHDGLLCPNCAYSLVAIQESRRSITCPECGYVIEDASKLTDRWRKTLKPKAIRIELRLGKDPKQGPSD